MEQQKRSYAGSQFRFSNQLWNITIGYVLFRDFFHEYLLLSM
jgi:hypothetical protein